MGSLDLECVSAIAECGSISRAARRLHTTQPALSRKLRQLEARLGTELFDRSRQPLAPTSAGQVYVAWARQVLQSERAMLHDLGEVVQHRRRKLRIGVSLPRYGDLLADVVEHFYAQTEGCTLAFVRVTDPEQVNDMLGGGTLDFTFMVPFGADPAVFANEEVCAEPILYVAPAAWGDLARPGAAVGDDRPAVGTSVIGSRPFIMPPPGYHIHKLARALMDSFGARFPVVLHSCNNDFTMQLIRRGVGASLLPGSLASSAQGGVRAYRVEELDEGSGLLMSHRRDLMPDADVAAFLSCFERRAPAHDVVSLLPAVQDMSA